MLVPPWAVHDQADRDAGLLDHRHGERQAQAGPLGPRLVLLGRALGAVLGVARVDRVGRIDQPVQRLLGLGPLAVHPQRHRPADAAA